MPHGDFSDLAGFTLIAGGVQQMVWPALQFASFGGPLRPFFDPTDSTEGAGSGKELELMTRWCGGMMLIIGCMLFSVRWNPINGKLTGLVLALNGGLSAHYAFHLYDAGQVVLRPWYLYSLIMIGAGIKIFFFPNPMPGGPPQKASKGR